ncbi:MAG: YggT family protein [Candidatus Dormibacteria bacterium]
MITSIVSELLQLLTLLVIVRVVLSWIPSMAWSRNKFVKLLYRIVDPLLKPFQKIIPTFGGMDVSPLALILVLEYLSSVIAGLGYGNFNVLGSVIGLVGFFFRSVAIIIFLLVLIRFLLRILHADRSHPFVQMIYYMSNPFVAPFQNLPTIPFDVQSLVASIVYFVIVVILQFIFVYIL